MKYMITYKKNNQWNEEMFETLNGMQAWYMGHKFRRVEFREKVDGCWHLINPAWD